MYCHQDQPDSAAHTAAVAGGSKDKRLQFKERAGVDVDKEQWLEDIFSKVSNFLMVAQLFWMLFGSLSVIPAFFQQVLAPPIIPSLHSGSSPET